MKVLSGAVIVTHMGLPSGWVLQKVHDMLAGKVAGKVPGKVPGWVLVVGPEAAPEEVPELPFGATSCNRGATLVYPPLGTPPSHNQSRHKCFVAVKNKINSRVSVKQDR